MYISYFLSFTLAYIIKIIFYKFLHKHYGTKSVKYFSIFSLLLWGFTLYHIYGMSTKDTTFSILNGTAWGFMIGNGIISPFKNNTH